MPETGLYVEAQRLAHVPVGWIVLALVAGAWLVLALGRSGASVPFAVLLMVYAWMHFFVPVARLRVGTDTVEVRYSRRRVLRIPTDQIAACDVELPPPGEAVMAWLVPGGLLARRVHGVAARTLRLTLLGGTVIFVASRRPEAVAGLVRQTAPLLERPKP